MMTRTLLARCAPLAIAASVALPVLPAAAQDTVTAEPVIVLPEAVPAASASPAPAPAIVLPETVVEPSPVVTSQTAPAEAATVAPPEPVAAEPAPRQRVAAPAPASKPAVTRSTPVAVAPVQEVVAPPVAVPVAPMANEQVAPEVATSPANNDATGEIALAAMLGALGLAAVGGIAFAASRRRRRHSDEVDQFDAVSYEPVDATPVVEPAMVREPEPTVAAPASSAFVAPSVATAWRSPRTSVRANGDPVALPAEMPETFEERDALLRELVAAKPDRANPFTSPRARARRAKLIMQSLGRNFASRKPRIDLSEYTNRWPTLRGWQPATA